MNQPKQRHVSSDIWGDDPAMAVSAGAPRAADNDLAASYQPRRTSFALAGIALNLLAAAIFVLGGGAARLHALLENLGLASHWLTLFYVTFLFIAHAAINLPLEFWVGYLEERQYGLAKHGIRAWTLDWLLGVAQHGVMFIVGGCLLVITQALLPQVWLAAAAVVFLALFCLTSYFAADLLPVGLFQLESADAKTLARWQRLLGPRAGELPPIIIFSAPAQREFAGGLLGLGRRQALFISRSTVELASDNLLRFVLLHELGHRRLRHAALGTLLGWGWIMAGMALCHWLAPSQTRGTGLFVAWLALILTLWLTISQPLLALLGRRMEYAADRYYLRNGGTVAEMTIALAELSRRNIAQTNSLPRRRTALHPLPSVAARLHRAARFAHSKGAN